MSKPAQHLKAAVDEWRQFAPSLRVTMLDDGGQVIDKRTPVREFRGDYWIGTLPEEKDEKK